MCWIGLVGFMVFNFSDPIHYIIFLLYVNSREHIYCLLERFEYNKVVIRGRKLKERKNNDQEKGQ